MKNFFIILSVIAVALGAYIISLELTKQEPTKQVKKDKTISKVDCIDSDANGKSEYTQGFVDFKGHIYKDACRDSQTLVEAVCENGVAGKRTITCPDGCEQNKCVSTHSDNNGNNDNASQSDSSDDDNIVSGQTNNTPPPSSSNSVNCPAPLSKTSDGGCECLDNCRVLCDGQIWENYNGDFSVGGPAYVLTPAESNTVIRKCTFKDANHQAIRIAGAENVLIEDNIFENLRSEVPGVDMNAIAIQKTGSNITIRNNIFKNMGADGIQMGSNGSEIFHITIENNEFYVDKNGVGENGIDIKGGKGPIIITGNTFHGFRDCPGAPQDCSGGPGDALAIKVKNEIGDVEISRNIFYNNKGGVRVAMKPNLSTAHIGTVSIVNNIFADNLERGIILISAPKAYIYHNTFVGNSGKHLVLNNMKGTDCHVKNNIFINDAGVDEECGLVDNYIGWLDELSFRDPHNMDYHLTENSPAIDIGLNVYPPVTTDIDGDTRPNGEKPDMGADEFTK